MNIFWLVDIYCILFTEKWKIKNKQSLRLWSDSVSEIEVFISLAGFSYSNPSYTFPELIEEPYIIHFEMIGHPLIDSMKRICNDFNLNGSGNIGMITGSNMSGKSTFLRTVGVNLVLAYLGAPCCAKSGKVSNMKIFSSMHTQDNLEEGISSFYAELKRIEQLLGLIEKGEPIFFLLDEMFKGTNSEDRHKGGYSLIRQLGDLNAFGLISTHDLDLAKLAGKEMLVSNFSFNSEIRDDEMIFQYKISQDICKDFNASVLMKRSGIKILPEEADKQELKID
jgi:DNA mismatch repair ATPase MutS